MNTAILAGLLIDGTGSDPIEKAVILVEGTQIKALGRKGEIEIPPDSTVIDFENETILPGLIEAHSHIIYCGANRYMRPTLSLEHQSKSSAVSKHILMYRNCLDDMASGITTIRSLGADDDSDIMLRDLIADSQLPGPRIVASGKPLRTSHGTAAFLGEPADGIDGVTKAVRERISKGADVIKVFATNIQAGVGEKAYRLGDLTDVPAYTRPELTAICDEAHRCGIKVAAHAIGGPALKWAMEAGVDSVEHVNMIQQEDIEVFLRTKCVLSDPNLYLFFDREYGFESRPAWRELPTWWQHKVREAGKRTALYQKAAYEAGVRFALALDSGHGLIWREAKCMVDVLGASPMDTILALTRNTAELCGLEQTGVLKPGNLADLISVRGNPLQDITRLKEVDLIMKEGTRYDPFLSKFLEAGDVVYNTLLNEKNRGQEA
jgi:imidazolonepropionase-like amidohydrolase